MSIPNVFSSFEKLIPVLEAYKAAVMDPGHQEAQTSAANDQKAAFEKWMADQQPKAPAPTAPPGIDPAQFQEFMAWKQQQQQGAAPAATPTPAATPAATPTSSDNDVDLDKTYTFLEKVMGPNNVPAKVRSKFAERAFAAYKTKTGDTDSSITFDTFKKQFKKPEKRATPEGVPALASSTPSTPSSAPPPEKKQRVDTASLTSNVLSTVGV